MCRHTFGASQRVFIGPHKTGGNVRPNSWAGER